MNEINKNPHPEQNTEQLEDVVKAAEEFGMPPRTTHQKEADRTRVQMSYDLAVRKGFFDKPEDKEKENGKARKALAVGAAAVAATGMMYKAADYAFEGRSEVDDLVHYVEGRTPNDLNPNPSQETIEVEAPEK